MPANRTFLNCRTFAGKVNASNYKGNAFLVTINAFYLQFSE